MRAFACIAALGLTACATSPAPAPEHPSASEPAVEEDAARAESVRLGCEVVTASGGQAELAEEVRARIVERLAERWELEAPEEAVDRAVASLRRANSLSEAELDRALARQGETRASLRAQLRKQLLVLAVARVAIGEPPEVSDEAVDARMSVMQPQPASSDPQRLRVVRERVREMIAKERYQAALRAFVEQTKERWAEVSTTEIDGECVEEWPRIETAELQLSGTPGLPEEAIRSILHDRDVLSIGPGRRLPPTLQDRLMQAYRNAGYVRARIGSLRPSDGGDRWALPLAAGEVHTLGRIRVVELDGQGQPRLREGSEELVAELPVESGAVFSESAVAEALASLERRLEGGEEGEPMAVAPIVSVDGRVVNLDLLVVSEEMARSM